MNTEVITREVRILHLEDDEKDHLLVADLLKTNGMNCRFTLARTGEAFIAALKDSEFDLIISDFTLPSYDGLSALSRARELRPGTPFIFFSGTIGEDVAVDTLKHGAADYVLKQRPNRLVAAIHAALRNSSERRGRQRAEHALRQSEERFRIVTRATNDVIWEWDVPADRVFFSQNFQAVFGHREEELSMPSSRWFDFIHPDDKQRVMSGLSALLASGGHVWWSEHRVRRADDTYAHIFDRATIIYDGAGKAVRMVGVTIDVSERKHAEEKIQEQAELLDKAQDAIIVLDLNGRVTYWNKSAERIYGWTAAEVMGKDALQVLFRGVSPPQIEAATKADAEQGEWTGELTQFTRDGRSIVVQGRSTLIRDGAGQPKSRLLINTDMTEHKRLEERFLRAQRLESLGVLVSGIAHDLNNALSPILIGVNILNGDTKLPDEMKGIVKTMETSARRGAEMVRQVLTFARGGEARKLPIHVEQLVKETGRIIADTFPKSIQCRVQTHPDLWPVYAIATQLHQVLMNLCVNARDAMPDGGLLRISLNNERFNADEAARVPGAKPGNYLCLAVADTGIGIPLEQREKVFQPFFTTKAPGKGTGLGLSTSLTIVKNHGGFMVVDSQVGRGTEFKIYLPAATGTAADDGSPPKPALPAGNGERILIVDDEESVLAIMRTTLEHYGYKVLTATGGLEAVAQFSLKRSEIDLVITDLVMPFMDGRATILTLRKMAPNIRVIAMSGVEQDKSGLLERGFKTSGFIAKPFTTESVVLAVQQALMQKT